MGRGWVYWQKRTLADQHCVHLLLRLHSSCWLCAWSAEELWKGLKTSGSNQQHHHIRSSDSQWKICCMTYEVCGICGYTISVLLVPYFEVMEKYFTIFSEIVPHKNQRNWGKGEKYLLLMTGGGGEGSTIICESGYHSWKRGYVVVCVQMKKHAKNGLISYLDSYCSCIRCILQAWYPTQIQVPSLPGSTCTENMLIESWKETIWWYLSFIGI